MTGRTKQLLEDCYEAVALGVWDNLAVGVMPTALTLTIGVASITVTPSGNYVNVPNNERLAQKIKKYIPSMDEVAKVYYNQNYY